MRSPMLIQENQDKYLFQNPGIPARLFISHRIRASLADGSHYFYVYHIRGFFPVEGYNARSARTRLFLSMFQHLRVFFLFRALFERFLSVG